MITLVEVCVIFFVNGSGAGTDALGTDIAGMQNAIEKVGAEEVRYIAQTSCVVLRQQEHERGEKTVDVASR